MEKSRCVGLLVAFLFWTVNSAAEEKAPFTRLQDAWKSVEGKCGSITKEEGGVYNLTVDPNDPGRWCVVSAASDHVVIAPREKNERERRTYTFIPHERIILVTYN